mmetsp:Transcript_36225/g.64821  ORF Transcript_36225/g.64821 Transcript_36225/m.64821 type:complete len:101 (+) Transcript_36225:1586-1888(+)
MHSIKKSIGLGDPDPRVQLHRHHHHDERLSYTSLLALFFIFISFVFVCALCIVVAIKIVRRPKPVDNPGLFIGEGDANLEPNFREADPFIPSAPQETAAK